MSDLERAARHYGGLLREARAESAEAAALRVVQPLIEEIASAGVDEVAVYQRRVRELAAELRELRGAE